MLHINKIKDTDPYFIIEPITRAIKNVSTSKTTVIQHDHNSERFTFELPRYIEGHDMTECNLIEVHYENGSEKGIYIVDDLAIIEGEENKLKCTWLLSQNATLNVGALKFLLRFSCIQDDGTVDYAWNTAPYAGITVSTGLYNTEHIEKTHPDVIAELIARIDRIVVGGGSGGSVDLLNYFTKDEVGRLVSQENLKTHNEILNTVSLSYLTLWTAEEMYAKKEEVNDAKLDIMEIVNNNFVDNQKIQDILNDVVGNIELALDELHNYAQSLVGGDAS